MDAERLRIEEDLRGQIDGEVYCDDLFVQMYASDGSIFETAPLGVVRPRTREDVASLVLYASDRGIPLFARGGGTGLAGDSLGRGLIVDFSRFFRRTIKIDEASVTVQPGVVLERLNSRLEKLGRRIGPDPAAAQVTTIGSVIALDASGSHWRAYGAASAHVLEIEVVLASGQIVRLSRLADESEPQSTLAQQVKDIINRHRTAIKGRTVRALVDRSGYALHDVERDGGIDLTRLLVGSEGTLALITEATLRTVPLPPHVGSVLLFFPTLEGAAHAAVELSTRSIRACDMMDRRHLSLAREMDPRYEFLIPPDAEAALLVECEGQTADDLRDVLQDVEYRLTQNGKLTAAMHMAIDPLDHQFVWQLPRQFTPTLHRMRGAVRPTPFVEDIAVPPAELPAFIRTALDALRRRRITASIFAHAAHGQLHIRPFINLANGKEVENLRQLAGDLYAATWAVGGTISGEHAEGYSRTPFASGQHGALMNAFREVKHVFDPRNILNPGKKVPLDSALSRGQIRRLTYPLLDRLHVPIAAATHSDKPASGFIQLQLEWRPEEMTHAARMCNGCGACRTQVEGTRMCPTFRPAPREEASPRSKANLVRGLLTGALPAGAVLEEEFKAIADLCVHCHMCRLECPANVDIPKLMAESKAAYIATNGLPFDDWLMSRIDRVCRYASRFPRLANWAIGNRGARWVLEKTLGVAQGRKLPYFARRPFLETSTQRRLAQLESGRGGEKVLLFVDTYANYCDPQLAEALVRILEHNGVSVYIPERQRESGMPMISQGVLPPARRLAEYNVGALAEAVRHGYKIVSTEPSAILALKREYLHLLGDDQDAHLVGENAMEACHYLWRLHRNGRLRLDFAPLDLTLGYHAPCHVKALEVGSPAVNLLKMVPGVKLHEIEKGCSGMAGLYGVKRKNYRMSLRIGLPLITEMRSASIQAATSECSTCRIQIEQGASIAAVHPVKLLALAYGMMPEIAESLHRPPLDLVVR